MKTLSLCISRSAATGVCLTLLSGCLYDKNSQVDTSVTPSAEDELRQTTEASHSDGLTAYTLPESDDFDKIPQDLNC